MEPTWLDALVSLAGLLCAGAVIWVLLCVLPYWLVLLPDRVAEVRARRAPPAPAVRPFELVTADLRRLQARYHHPARGCSFAKLDAARRAYDGVLAEACDALGHSHLLRVLPDSAELDRERARVESLLWLDGLRFGEAA